MGPRAPRAPVDSVTMLDALPANIALLDHRGVIVAVNGSWRRFARSNGLNLPEGGIGEDYLTVCRRAKGTASEGARAVAAGIRRVLAGKVPEFSFEYPCDAPSEARWFRCTVTPVRLVDGPGVVVMHVDLTERKRAEEERQRLAHSLGERVKELRALHQATQLLQHCDLDVAGLLQRIAALLPPAMQHPDTAAARVAFGREVRATPGFRLTRWRLEAEFVTAGRTPGRLLVVYRRKTATGPDAAFLPEEHQLLRSLADLLRAHFERREGEDRQRLLTAQLDEERHRLLEAQKVARVGSWVTNLADQRVTWSEETHRIFGTDPATFRPTHRAFLRRVHPDDRAAVDAAFLNSLTRRDAQAVEHRLLLPDGRIKLVEERWQVFADQNNRPVRAIGTCQDVTVRRQAERQLQEVQMLARMASRLARIGAWSVDVRTLTCFFSEEVCAIHGEAPGYAPTVAEALAFYPADHRPVLERHFFDCVREGAAFDLELQLTNKAAQRVWVRSIGEAVRDEAGRIVRVQGVLQDISDRRQTEEETRRLAQRLTTTLESITDAFFTVDRKWNFTYLNGEAERLLRRGRGELLGLNIWDEFPAAADSAFEREYRRAMAENVTVGFEAHYPAPLDLWFDVRAYPSEEGLAVYFHDITEARRAREELRQGEQRFREMAENIGMVFYNYDPVANRLLYANSAYEKIWERSLASVFADPFSYMDGIHPDDKPGAEEASRRQLAGEETFVDFRVVRANGSIRWVREHAVPIRDAAGRVERIVGTMRDITEGKLTGLKLYESEERFRLLAQATTDAVWDWDLETGALWWNEGYETLFGYARAEADPTIKSWTDFIHPEDYKHAVDGIHRVIDGGGTEWSDEYRFRRKDGSYIPVSDRGRVIRDAAGRPVRMVGGMEDLTERKHTEDKLREQAALLDKANDAILVRDLSHRILYWNHAAERLYGWTAAEALGRSVQELLHGISSAFLDATREVLSKGEWTGEIDQFAKDGRIITVEGSWTLVRDEAGRPKSILAINSDVTERKQLQRQFLRAQRMESIGTLAGGIAHDLNNLLAPIVMGAGLLQRHELSESGREVLRNIERSARRSTELVKQVLSFARGVEGERIPLQLGHIVREISHIIASTFPRNVTFEADLPPDLWLVLGDATQLNQVLLNLCVNARDAMPDGGRLSLRAANRRIDAQYAATDRTVTAGDYVVVEVSDTGCGMSREVQDRIFEPFFTTKDLGKGTGLGLSTVLGIVRSHGGAVTVRSEPGRGSTFRVWLPAQTEPVAEPTAAAPRPALPEGRGEQILLVDDELPVLTITRQTLEAFGYRVLTAGDGAQAVGLYALHQKEIAAVLTDLMMPVMDGPMLIASLQRINPQVRVVAATGLKASEYVNRAKALGVVHFLTKPYTADALLSMMHEVLAGSPEKAADTPP